MNFSSLLAIGFSSPFLPALGGWFGTAVAATGLASIPIIIHLLNKRRFRERQWAAMQFLLAALKKNARRLRLEQLLLLALRVLLVVVLIAALAQPYLEHAGLVFRSGERYHKVLVIDGTLSMGYRPAEHSRFDRAKEIARRVVEEASQGDAVSVVLLAAPPRVVIGQPSFDRSEVSREIDALALTQGGGDLPATVAQVEEVLERGASSFTQREVYFLTDLQRATWLSSDRAGANSETLHERMQRIDEQATMVVIDLGQSGGENAAIVDVDVNEPFITAGQPATIRGVIENFGRRPLAPLAVELWLNAQLEDRQNVEVAAGSQATVTFTPTFAAPTDHAVELRIASDALKADDRRFLALGVASAVRVLCVNGKAAGAFFEQATAYLQTALAPQTSSSSVLAIEPAVVSESSWGDEDLGRYACVFFCNVGQFTDDEYETLRRYLEAGGAVVWFGGDQVVSENYDRVLYRDAKGILPLRITGRVGDASVQEKLYAFDPLNYAHPILKPFQSEPRSGLVTSGAYAYLKGVLPPDGAADLVMAYDGGDPAVVTRRIGRGWATFVTTSADRSWTLWPLSPSYVAVVHQLLRHGIADRRKERAAFVGQAVRFDLAGRSGGEVVVETPERRQDTVPVPPGAAFQYPGDDPSSGTDAAGIYQITAAPAARSPGAPSPESSRTLFAINVDIRESDLARISREELQRNVWSGVTFAYLTNFQDLNVGLEGPVRHRGDLHRAFVYALLLLLFAELLVAWKFGHYSSAA